MISIRNLSKKYGQVTVVNDLNLEINREFFVFLGPNGAGKTTTIKMMTGLLRPDSGSVFINGYDLSSEPIKAKSSFGFAPEQAFLYEKLTGQEFLKFIATIYRLPGALAQKRISQLTELFELDDRGIDFIEDYSHGMKQKISLIAALLHDPAVLFLDEPTVGLDPKSVKNLKDLLQGLVKKGKTVFMSTHILEIAETMCDRIGIINQGNLVAFGSPEEIKSSNQQLSGSLEDIFLKLTHSETDGQVENYLKDA